MDFLLNIDWIAVTIAFVAICISFYTIWRKEHRAPNLTEIGDRIETAAKLVQEISLLLDEMAIAYKTGKLSEAERLRQIFVVLHARYPTLDEELLKTTIENTIMWVKITHRDDRMVVIDAH